MRRLPFDVTISILQNIKKGQHFGIITFLVFFPTLVVFAQESPHGKIDLQCTDCHTTSGWTVLVSPMKFSHSQTGFRLVGQHKNAACADCHTGLKFTDTPSDCYSCHRHDYDAAVSIDHRLAGFGTNCARCHRASAPTWQASFDHQLTDFPTRGAHEAVPCLSCHIGNRYRGTPIECVACHEKEYVAAQNPNHITAGFNTECAVCHRALTWQPAAFYPHPYFPIHAGDRHSPGVWNSCTDCHSDQPNYSTFACINCHEHSRTRTDQRHSNVEGYVYESSACYRCHPTGGG